MSDFEPLKPKNLGHYIDLQPKSENRALQLVQQYIDALQTKIAQHEKLRDDLASMILELIKMMRETPIEESRASLLSEIEKTIKEM